MRLHTCFENCKDYKYDDFKGIYTKDTRVNCTEYEKAENKNHERYLLCLYPDDKCEQTVHENEFGADPIVIAWLRGLIVLVIVNPIQFLFELLCIYLIKIKYDDQKAGDNCKVLTFQLFVTFIYIYVFALSVNDFILILTHGRLWMTFSTFFFCLIVDQFKSFFTLGIVYIVIVRRFMHLEINEEEYIDPMILKLPKQERAIPKLKE